MRAELEKVQSDFARSEKTKKKLQGELDDTVVQMERERNNATQMASKQKKFDAQLAEERAQLEALRIDRDNVEKTARNNETKALSLQNLVSELEDKLAESERGRKNLQVELQDLVETKDDVGKSVHELEKAKRLLEQQLNEQKTQVEELEDELQATEDAKLRLEVNLQAAKAQFERDLAAKEDSIEDGRRNLVKQVRLNNLFQFVLYFVNDAEHLISLYESLQQTVNNIFAGLDAVKLKPSILLHNLKSILLSKKDPRKLFHVYSYMNYQLYFCSFTVARNGRGVRRRT